jgi:hypothetical protein
MRMPKPCGTVSARGTSNGAVFIDATLTSTGTLTAAPSAGAEAPPAGDEAPPAGDDAPPAGAAAPAALPAGDDELPPQLAIASVMQAASAANKALRRAAAGEPVDDMATPCEGGAATDGCRTEAFSLENRLWHTAQRPRKSW